MFRGEVNAELFKFTNRDEVIKYLSGLDFSKQEKNEFYKYWKSLAVRNNNIKNKIGIRK